MTIEQCCEGMSNEFERELVRDILTMFVEKGYSYLVSAINPDRIYCYIRKSKETLIINKTTYIDRLADNGFSIQIRITSKQSYETLNALSDNTRSCILNGRDCKAPYCCNCGHEYHFEYNNEKYMKCHMLCDNYMLYNLTSADRASIFRLIENEMPAPRSNKK